MLTDCVSPQRHRVTEKFLSFSSVLCGSSPNGITSNRDACHCKQNRTRAKDSQPGSRCTRFASVLWRLIWGFLTHLTVMVAHPFAFFTKAWSIYSRVGFAPVPDGVNSNRAVGLIGEAYAIVADS